MHDSGSWLPIELPPDFRREVKKLAPILDKGADLFEMARDLLHQEKIEQSISNSLYTRVVYLIFSRSFCTFQSIQILLRGGFAADAACLLAGLMENLIDLKYLALSPAERSKQYANFEIAERYELASRFAGSSNPHTASAAAPVRNNAYKKHREIIDAIDYRKGWAQKSVRQRAREVGLATEYDELYARLCTFKHTTPFGIAGVIRVQGGVASVTTGPSVRGIFWYSWIASNCFALILRELSITFQLGTEHVVDAYLNSARETCTRFQQKNPDMLGGA